MSTDREIIAEGMESERERLRIVEHNHGAEGAVRFAAQTMRLYRRAIVLRLSPACDAIFRLRMIGSYLTFREYLKTARERPNVLVREEADAHDA